MNYYYEYLYKYMNIWICYVEWIIYIHYTRVTMDMPQMTNSDNSSSKKILWLYFQLDFATIHNKGFLQFFTNLFI